MLKLSRTGRDCSQSVLFGDGVLLPQSSECWDYRYITTPTSILNLDSLKTTELSKFLSVSVGGVQSKGGTRESIFLFYISTCIPSPVVFNKAFLKSLLVSYCSLGNHLYFFPQTPVFPEIFCHLHISPAYLRELLDESSKGFSRQKHYRTGSLMAILVELPQLLASPYPGFNPTHLLSTLYYAAEKHCFCAWEPQQKDLIFC